MSDLNRVMLIGRLGADPEVKFLPSGAAVCNLRLATGKKWKDKDGNMQARTEWHRIVVWGAQAETCGSYLRKGSQVFIEGEIETREYTDKGQGERRYVTEVKARDVRFLGSRGDTQGQAPSSQPVFKGSNDDMGYGEPGASDGEDLPF